MPSNIIAETISRAIKMLDATGVQYKVIDSTTGQEWGGLQVIKEHKRKTSTLPIGTISKHVRPLIEHLEVGGVAQIPYMKGVSGLSLRSTATSMASSLWGKGAHCSSLDATSVQILRIS